MRISELKKEVEQAIQKHADILEGWEMPENPQAKDCFIYNQHILETLQAVLARINGDRIALKLI